MRAILLSFAIFAAPSAFGAERPVALTTAQRAIVKVTITSKLRDPESVRFGEMAGTADANGVVTVCGLVNAKNGFGGYTGMQPYSGVITTGVGKLGFFVMSLGGSASEQKATRQLCAK